MTLGNFGVVHPRDLRVLWSLYNRMVTHYKRSLSQIFA